MDNLPFAGGVYEYQIEFLEPALLGSPLSWVAPTVVPISVPPAPTSTSADAKLSFGAAAMLWLRNWFLAEFQ
jgi:hypothetical protein